MIGKITPPTLEPVDRVAKAMPRLRLNQALTALRATLVSFDSDPGEGKTYYQVEI